MKRTYIYIDGFNLYYRGLRNSPYKWLDVKAVCRRLLDDTHQIDGIKYFTAIVSGARDSYKPTNQQAYIKALEECIPELAVYYGHFLTSRCRAILAKPTPLQKTVEVIKTEEKGSDVNLAVHLLNDAWLNKYDCAVVLSNDGDLYEAMHLVKEQHKKTIGLMLPFICHPSKALMRTADFVKRIRRNTLIDSQLPHAIPEKNIRIPLKWELEIELHKQNIRYTSIQIKNIARFSNDLQKVSFQYSCRRDQYCGQASIRDNKLSIDKLEPVK